MKFLKHSLTFFALLGVMILPMLASCSSGEEPTPIPNNVEYLQLKIAVFDPEGNDLLIDDPDNSLYYAPVSAYQNGGNYPLYWDVTKSRLYADTYLANNLMYLPAAEEAEVPFFGLVRKEIDGNNYICFGYFHPDSIFERHVTLTWGFNDKQTKIVFSNKPDESTGKLHTTVQVDDGAEYDGDIATLYADYTDIYGYPLTQKWDYEPYTAKIDIVDTYGRSLLLEGDSASVFGDNISATYLDGTTYLAWDNSNNKYIENTDYDVPGRASTQVVYTGLKYLWSTFYNGYRQQYTGNAILTLGQFSTEIPYSHEVTINWDNNTRHDKIRIEVTQRQLSSKNTPLPNVTLYLNDELYTDEVILLVKD